MPSRVQAAPLRPAQPSNMALWGQFTYGRGAPRGLPGASGGGGCPIGRVPHQGATHVHPPARDLPSLAECWNRHSLASCLPDRSPECQLPAPLTNQAWRRPCFIRANYTSRGGLGWRIKLLHTVSELAGKAGVRGAPLGPPPPLPPFTMPPPFPCCRRIHPPLPARAASSLLFLDAGEPWACCKQRLPQLAQTLALLMMLHLCTRYWSPPLCWGAGLVPHVRSPCHAPHASTPCTLTHEPTHTPPQRTQHQQHHHPTTVQNLLYIGARDQQGRVWASVLAGAPGFITSDGPNHLAIAPGSQLPAGALHHAVPHVHCFATGRLRPVCCQPPPAGLTPAHVLWHAPSPERRPCALCARQLRGWPGP